MEVPWWSLSPSPFSLVFYAILIFIGARRLLKANSYHRFKPLVASTDSFFIVGFTVLIGDLSWSLNCAMRFLPFYPQDTMQILFVITRNIAGLAFCYLFARTLIHWRSQTTMIIAMNILFQAFWFTFSPSPAYTDWTYAIRNNYPTTIILTSFFISHIIGKSLTALIWNSLTN